MYYKTSKGRMGWISRFPIGVGDDEAAENLVLAHSTPDQDEARDVSLLIAKMLGRGPLARRIGGQAKNEVRIAIENGRIGSFKVRQVLDALAWGERIPALREAGIESYMLRKGEIVVTLKAMRAASVA